MAGAPGCSGCQAPVCVALVSIEAFGLSGGTIVLTGDDRDLVSWQGDSTCGAANMSHKRTWGGVKTLYR